MARALRKMTDSTTASDNPKDDVIVAGYVNGLYANVDQLRRRYPHARIVTITVNSQADADVIDCEDGDANPSSSAVWAKRQVARGKHPTIYCSLAVVPHVLAACKEQGLKWHRDFEIWQAHYDGVAKLPRGFVAKQYNDHGPQGQHYDVSVVAAYWPGVDPKPKRRVHLPRRKSKPAPKRKWRGWSWLRFWLRRPSK
jgi:hypothetical protein